MILKYIKLTYILIFKWNIKNSFFNFFLLKGVKNSKCVTTVLSNCLGNVWANTCDFLSSGCVYLRTEILRFCWRFNRTKYEWLQLKFCSFLQCFMVEIKLRILSSLVVEALGLRISIYFFGNVRFICTNQACMYKARHSPN